MNVCSYHQSTQYYTRNYLYEKHKTLLRLAFLHSNASASSLSVADDIDWLYIGILDRAPDAAGHDYWSNQRSSGVLTYEQISAVIMFQSPESPFFGIDPFETVAGTSTRSMMINVLFNNLYERNPTPEEQERWVYGEMSHIDASSLVVRIYRDNSPHWLSTKRQAAWKYRLRQGGNCFDMARAHLIVNVPWREIETLLSEWEQECPNN